MRADCTLASRAVEPVSPYLHEDRLANEGAAFFRRTVVMKLSYRCQNDHNCNVTQKQRYSCRSCRYRKCIAKGMRTTMVLPGNPDKLGGGGSQLSPSSQSDPSTPPSNSDTISTNDQSTPNESSISVTEKLAIYEKQQILKYKNIPITSFILPIKLSLTQQALVALNEHLLKWPMCSPEHVKAGETLSISEVSTFINQEIENIANFCMSLDDFAILEKEQKWAVFKKFWGKFMCLERYKACVRCFGQRPPNIWLSYSGKYYDLNNAQEWTGMDPEMKRMFEFLRPSCIKEMALLGSQLIRTEPSDFELVFCLLQTMWNLKRDTNLTDSTLAVSENVRKRLAQEVHDYYTIQANRHNYASRLMQMMNIVASMDEIEQQRKEDRTVCRTFELCKDDLFYSDFAD